MQQEMNEISLSDMAQALRRRWRLFVSVFVVVLLLVVAYVGFKSSVLIWQQQVRVAAYQTDSITTTNSTRTNNTLLQLSPLPQQDSYQLSLAYFPQLLAELQSTMVVSPLLSDLQFKVNLVTPKIAQYDAHGQKLDSYLPDPSVFMIDVHLKKNTVAAKAQASTVFKVAVAALQHYQQPQLSAFKQMQTQQVQLAQQGLARLNQLNQSLEQYWTQNTHMRAIKPASLTAATHAAEANVLGVNMANLIAVNNMSAFGLKYQQQVASLQQQVFSAQTALKSLRAAYLVGPPHFVSANSSQSALILMGGLFAALLLAAFSVAIAELCQQRD